jgi:uncharacterized protein (UPF0332 family)
MSFDPIQFLEFSKGLCGGSLLKDLETITRVIIGRAYYSAFLHAKEYLKEKENISFVDSRLDHKFVENMLKIKVNRILGSYIRELSENREAADYTLDNPAVVKTRSGATRVLHFDKNAQNNSIRLAETIISQLPRT